MHSVTAPAHQPVPVEAMRAAIRKVCGAFDVEPARRDGVVAGHVATREVGSFETAIVGFAAGRIDRSSRLIRTDPGEHLFLIVQQSGHCRMAQGACNELMGPGDMFMVDSVQPSSFQYGAGTSNQVSLHLPRAEMVHRFGPACTGGVAFDRDDPLSAAMRALVEKMMAAPGEQPRLGQALLSVLDASFHDRPARPCVTLLSRALALADAHCTDPGFGPGELAERLNVSTRVLQRHFQPLGQTPGERLLDNRLKLAHGLLAAGSPHGIAVAAYASGFNDLSYFYREFRRKYGVTPGTVARRR